MDYYVTKSRFISDYRNCIVLRIDNWDDYGFKTSFFASYFDVTGKRQELGSVKIAIVGEECYKTADELPEKFTGLPDNAISLWQSAESYQMVKVLCDSIKMDIFSDLNDIAYNLELLKKYMNESVLKDSLMRAVTRYTIENQFHRITLGRAKLTEYSFRYQIKEGALLQFDVRPNSCPPSNIHVLIGGNGVGKTTLIRNMITSICDIDNRELRGSFVYKETDTFRDSEQFANVIGVSFSPFDDFSCIQRYENNRCLFTYIGTRKEYKLDKGGNSITNLLEDIEKHFVEGLNGCLSNATKREDLGEVIKILENDPMFYEYKLTDMIVNSDVNIEYNNLQNYKNLFSMMSSGHKVVLSIIVRCIDRMAEKTILFLD
ncbi:MAG: hypothetical protein J6M92_00030 [Oribacterium sp.]|nr:hypothetical protein [Oribacterium sp.]